MREPLNPFLDASLIYLDDYRQVEGTRLEFVWSKDWAPMKPLSSIEFDDHALPLLTRWRDATFGRAVANFPTSHRELVDHPLILDSVVENTTQRALERLARFMPGLGATTSTDEVTP